MNVYRMMEECQLVTCAEGGIHGIMPTGVFAFLVLHECGGWTPRDDKFCAYCGDSLFGDDDDDDDDDPDLEPDSNASDDGTMPEIRHSCDGLTPTDSTYCASCGERMDAVPPAASSSSTKQQSQASGLPRWMNRLDPSSN